MTPGDGTPDPSAPSVRPPPRRRRGRNDTLDQNLRNSDRGVLFYPLAQGGDVVMSNTAATPNGGRYPKKLRSLAKWLSRATWRLRRRAPPIQSDRTGTWRIGWMTPYSPHWGNATSVGRNHAYHRRVPRWIGTVEAHASVRSDEHQVTVRNHSRTLINKHLKTSTEGGDPDNPILP